uniref:Uncharacterized protein n=1 Tax=Timema shepardi TaxID=629360 RepID=A0A7R9BBV9_TIMSH|nr:unnamed protein product [Timema shepardi]
MKIPDVSTLKKDYMHSAYLFVVQTFDEEQAVAITEANAAIYCSSVNADLAYVKSNFGNLPGAITALEARDLPLVKAVKIVREIEENLNQASGSVGTAIIDQFNRVLQRNPGQPCIFPPHLHRPLQPPPLPYCLDRPRSMFSEPSVTLLPL